MSPEVLNSASFLLDRLTEEKKRCTETWLAGNAETDLKVLLIRLKRGRGRETGGLVKAGIWYTDTFSSAHIFFIIKIFKACTLVMKTVYAGEDSQLLSPHREAQHSSTPYIMFKTRISRKLAVAPSEGVTFLIKKHKLAFGELGVISSSF